MRRLALAASIALPLLALAAPATCAAGPGSTGSVASIVVEVNGTPITRADLDEALAMDDEWLILQRKGQSAAANELKKRIEGRVIDLLIDEILFTEAARIARITLTPEEEREVQRLFEDRVKQDWGSVDALEQLLKARGLPIEQLRRRHRLNMLVNKLLHEEAGRSSFVRPVDIREYYETHRESYRVPGRVDYSVIMVAKAGRSAEEARAQIEAAAKALEDGKPFDDVAKGYPDGPNYQIGGASQAVTIAELGRKEYREALQPLKEGERSGVVETPDQLLIFKLDKLTAESFKKFPEVEDSIYELLEKRARAERLDGLRKRLREKAFIKRK